MHTQRVLNPTVSDHTPVLSLLEENFVERSTVKQCLVDAIPKSLNGFKISWLGTSANCLAISASVSVPSNIQYAIPYIFLIFIGLKINQLLNQLYCRLTTSCRKDAKWRIFRDSA